MLYNQPTLENEQLKEIIKAQNYQKMISVLKCLTSTVREYYILAFLHIISSPADP